MNDFMACEFWRFVLVQQKVVKLAQTAIDFPPMQAHLVGRRDGHEIAGRQRGLWDATDTFSYSLPNSHSRRHVKPAMIWA
jgi:hypothetical protein